MRKLAWTALGLTLGVGLAEYVLPVGGLFAPSLLVRGDDYGHLYSAVMECGWILLAAGVAMAGFLRRCRDA